MNQNHKIKYHQHQQHGAGKTEHGENFGHKKEKTAESIILKELEIYEFPYSLPRFLRDAIARIAEWSVAGWYHLS
jgi:hypothetical protein